MTQRQPPTYINGQSYNAEADRNAFGSVIVSGGVPSASDFIPSVSTAGGLRVTIGAGRIWVIGGSAFRGAYNCVNDSSVDVTLPGAHATLPRYDLVVARVKDPDYGASPAGWALTVLQGTANATPSTTPAGLLPDDEIIAQVRVDAAATSLTALKIASRRRRAMTSAGVVVASQVERDALPVYPGLQVFRFDLNRVDLWTGSAWIAGPAMDGNGGVTATAFAVAGGAATVDGAGTITGNSLQSRGAVGTSVTGLGDITLTGGGIMMSQGGAPYQHPNGITMTCEVIDGNYRLVIRSPNGLTRWY